MNLIRHVNYGSRPGISFWCPGCREAHVITIDADGWSFNGNDEAPTIAPSVRVSGDSTVLCHSLVENGTIQFLADCIHELAGQTMPLPAWPDAIVGEADADTTTTGGT